jgi:hypothetical protein
MRGDDASASTIDSRMTDGADGSTDKVVPLVHVIEPADLGYGLAAW